MEPVHPQLTAEEALSLSSLTTPASSKTCGWSPLGKEVLAFLPSPPYQCVPWQQVLLQVTEERKQRHVVTSTVLLSYPPTDLAPAGEQLMSGKHDLPELGSSMTQGLADLFLTPPTFISISTTFHIQLLKEQIGLSQGVKGSFGDMQGRALPSRQSLKHRQ